MPSFEGFYRRQRQEAAVEPESLLVVQAGQVADATTTLQALP
jgi:hypothetical protein